ncbi:MAG: zinc ABC transporter substrate-binding protein, partial [Deltaproteobacteria bacterium]|nr:zinc ABC transporter substrate-binding protein [Deltaproteobacteria bacterium]
MAVPEIKAEDRLKIFVSIPPQKYFVKALGGPHVAVSILVGSGQSPHTYEVTPKQMAELGKADIYFSIGVDFERTWLKKIKAVNPRLKIVAIDQNLTKLKMTGSHTGHGHGATLSDLKDVKEQEERELRDPHVWLNPNLVKQMARVITETLIEALPAFRGEFQENLKSFKAEMTTLDSEIKHMLKPLKNRRFFVYHPSWGYFAHAYGLTQVPIEVDGKEPGAKSLHHIIDEAKKVGIKVIFAQRGFSSKSAMAVARVIGARMVFLDPLAEDYMTSMKKTAE